MFYLDHLNIVEQFRQFPPKLLVWNLFYDRRKSSVLTVKKEIHTTRLYVVLFIAIFFILFIYTVLIEESVTIHVDHPSQTTYEELFLSHGSSLQCPCSEISTRYKSFVKLNVTLHQICLSPFIQIPWIKSIFGDGDWSNISVNQFRIRGIAYFTVLRGLCTIAQSKINGSFPYFLERHLITSQVIPEKQLVSQINSEIDQIERSFASAFFSLVEFSRDNAQNNQLMSAYSSNWVYSPQYNRNMSYYAVPTRPVSHGEDCSCATSSTCVEPVYIDETNIPGLVLGCSVYESLLRSTLICLYNQTCLDLINIANLSNIHPLNHSSTSPFRPNMTVNEMIPNMFIEGWSSNISYSTFYTQCQPLSCIYSVSKQKDTVKIITILLGVYGGLTTVLRFVAPLLITIARKIIH